MMCFSVRTVGQRSKSSTTAPIAIPPTGIDNMSMEAKDPLLGITMSDDDVLAQLVASSLSELSFEERDDALSDVNGVPATIDETPELLRGGTCALARELDAIQNKGAYNLALQQCPSFVTSMSFQLRFLRADRFNVYKAAHRMVRHFETKRELFAEETLGREIYPSDLSQDDLEALHTGCIRILQLRDQAGRLVGFYAKSLLPSQMSLITRLRLAWYVWNVASRDVTTQKKGFVMIYWLLGCQYSKKDMKASHTSPNALVSLIPLLGSLPVRISAVHTCFDDHSFRYVMNIGSSVAEAAVRVRIKFHSGSLHEVFYSLMPYGIPKAILPTDDAGTVEVGSLLWWLASYNHTGQEPSADSKSPQSLAAYRLPGEKDVLLGRGRTAEGSPGNLRLKRAIESNFAHYEKSTKFEKTIVAHAIYLRLKQEGATFLKKENENWVEVDAQTARDKITHTFRNHRRNKNQQQTRPQPPVQTQNPTSCFFF